MKEASRILAALAALDPHNDEHWTSAGLPSMAAVTAMAGEVTRRQVEAVAPEFSRTNLVLPAEDDEPAVAPAAPAPAEVPAPIAAPVPSAPAELAEVAAQPEDPRAAAEREAEARIADLVKTKAAAMARMAAAKAEADQVERDVAAVQRELEERFPPLSDAERYQQIVRRSQEERRKRVEQHQAAMAVLGQTARSPLDRAMAARRGWGLTRPSYPVTK
jgi:hypothetical protein